MKRVDDTTFILYAKDLRYKSDALSSIKNKNMNYKKDISFHIIILNLN